MPDTDLYALVKVAIATVGVGDLTFGPRAQGFLTPAMAGAIDGKKPSYLLRDGLDTEEGWLLIKDGVTKGERNVVRSVIGGLVGTDPLNLSGAATLAFHATERDILNKNKNLADLPDRTAARENLSSGIRSVGAAATITKADWGRTIEFNTPNDINVTPDSAAALTNGFECHYRNVGTGLVTLVGAIDGMTNSLVPEGDSGRLTSNGVALRTDQRPASVILESSAASNVTAVDIDFPKGFAEIEIKIPRLRAVNDGVALFARVRSGGVVQSGAAYSWVYSYEDATGGAADNAAATGQTELFTFGSQDNGSATVTSGRIVIAEPRNPNSYYRQKADCEFFFGDGTFARMTTGGTFASPSVDGVRLYFGSGNISEIRYTVIGHRRNVA
jgi:hypothetical protein